MSKQKSLSSYLPTKEEKETTYVQARLPKGLVDEVKVILEKDSRSWREFLEAACRKFVDENGRQR